MFCDPLKDALIRPIKEVVDEKNPPLFLAKTFKEHIDNKLFDKADDNWLKHQDYKTTD
jgi:hypothetical protein